MIVIKIKLIISGTNRKVITTFADPYLSFFLKINPYQLSLLYLDQKTSKGSKAEIDSASSSLSLTCCYCACACRWTSSCGRRTWRCTTTRESFWVASSRAPKWNRPRRIAARWRSPRGSARPLPCRRQVPTRHREPAPSSAPKSRSNRPTKMVSSLAKYKKRVHRP